MKPCIYDHDGPITTLYGVPPTAIEKLPKRCSACGEALTYAEFVVFVSEPSYQREYKDEQGNVVMTCEEVPCDPWTLT